MKTCTKCNKHLDKSQFSRDSKSKDGLRSACKKCISLVQKKYRIKNKVALRSYNEDWRKKNKEYFKKWKKSNKHKAKKYYKKHKSKLKEYRKEYYKKRITTDNNYRIACNLRSRLRSAIKNKQKAGSFVRDLGCTVDYLLKYLENLFMPGMSWENYGDWHIDHIKPLSHFNLENRKEFLLACNYTNLQPLWAEDNLSKGAR